MSMISGLIDELNKSADEWNASNMFELARMCREAADTIWKLRDDLQRANAENAKLRELVHKVLQFERAGCEGCPYASTCDVDCLYEPNCPMREDIERDMRELEVDACPNCGAKVVEPTTNDVDVEVAQCVSSTTTTSVPRSWG